MTRSSCVQEVLDTEADEAQTELSGEFARMDAIIGAPERLDRVADDLAAHFSDRCRTLPGKAMVVAYSRRIAAEYALRLRERLGEDAVEAVFNAASDRRPPDQRLSQEQAAAEGGRGALQGPRLRRCASWSSRTCG